MKTLLLTLLMASTPLFAASEPIALLVDELSTDRIWKNGSSPVIRLPKTASPEEVVVAYFDKTTDRKGKIADFNIQEIRAVKISGSLPETYTAVRCGTEFGGRIILMQYASPESGWWTKSYETRYYTQKRQ